jgi:hypothetical protein
MFGKYAKALLSASNMSDFLQPDARPRHGKRQPDFVLFDENTHSSSQNETNSSGKVMDKAATLQTLSTNRAGSRGRSDNCFGKDKRTSESGMLAESSPNTVSQSRTQRNEYDENSKRGDENKMCF